MNQQKLLQVIRHNHDAQRNSQAAKYVIDSRAREVFNEEPAHTGEAIYIEKNGVTRAIYHTNAPTTRIWGSDAVHEWLDAVHDRLRYQGSLTEQV